MATPQIPSKSTISTAVQAALPLPVPVDEGHDLVLLKPTPELNPRNMILKDIAARSNADADTSALETMPVTDDDGQPVDPATEVVETEAITTDAVAEPAAAVAPPDTAIHTFDPEAEIDVVVDGKPMKVKGSQIIERGKMAIQKEIAADYKLELASRLLAEAEAQRKAVPAHAAAPAADQVSDANLAQAIQFGTQEQATAAIVELRKRAGGDVTQDSIKEMMVKTMPQVVSDQLAFQEGVNFVKTEYADLLADPYLNPLFVMKEQQMRQAGDKRPYKDVYKAIGDDIRTHFNRPKTALAAPAPAAVTREQKVAAKAAAPAAPRLASARMEAAAEAKPPTREEVFEKMRRARGQAMPLRMSQQ